MKALLLACLAPLVCGCTAQQVRCHGHLERINVPVATSPGAAAPGDRFLPGVR